TFYRPLLSELSASAGSLTVVGVVLLLAGSLLWRRGIRRRWWNGACAALLVLAAPYLVRYFGRGFAPPAGGVSFAFWMSWEAAVATASMALILGAAGLLRGPTEPEAEIRLASVDLPSPLVAALVRSPKTAQGPRVERLERVPGVHYVLVAPFSSGDVLTVGVGPRTRLIPADRVARFLQGDAGVQPPYTISLSPPAPAPPNESAQVIWTRTGWSVRGERRIDLAGGVRHVHVRVDLQGPAALLVRGTLVVVLDIALLAACWLGSLVVAEGWRPRLPTILAALRTSYRVRLTAALSGFFVVPVLLFAVWS